MKRKLCIGLAAVTAAMMLLTGCGSSSSSSTVTSTTTSEAAVAQTSKELAEEASDRATSEIAASDSSTDESGVDMATEVDEHPENKLGRKIKVGYDIYYLGNSWSVQLYQEFKWNAENEYADDIDVTYVQSDNDSNKQIANLEDLIAQGVDVIITTPIDATALNATLQDAMDEGIKVILLAATIDGDSYDTMINVKETDFGAKGAQWLADQLDGKGNIIMLNGISGYTSNEQRKEGAEAIFAKYPEINILAAEDAGWDYATAKTVVADLLATYPNIDGVWSQGGAMTLGAIEAFQAANRELVPMTGEDNNGYLKAVIKNKMEGIGVAKPTWLTRVAINSAIKLMNGETVEKDDIFPVMTITTEEMPDYVHEKLSDDVWCGTEMPEDVLAKIFSN